MSKTSIYFVAGPDSFIQSTLRTFHSTVFPRLVFENFFPYITIPAPKIHNRMGMVQEKTLRLGQAARSGGFFALSPCDTTL